MEIIEKFSSVFSVKIGNYREIFLGFFLPFGKLSRNFLRFFPSKLENFLGFFRFSKSDGKEIFFGFFSVFSKMEGKNRIPPYGGNLGKFPSCGRHGKKDSGREGLRPPSLEDLFPCRD